MLPTTIIGWIVLVVVGMIVWKNPSGAGTFVFHTVPDHVSSFISSA